MMDLLFSLSFADPVKPTDSTGTVLPTVETMPLKHREVNRYLKNPQTTGKPEANYGSLN